MKLKVFIAYSREDKKYLTNIKKHLSVLERNELIQTWFDGEIVPGSVWERDLLKTLLTSDIVLLLISSDFIASDYCYNIEMQKAFELHRRNKIVLVPIILRACGWELTPIADIQVLPSNGIPINSNKWGTIDEPYNLVLQSINQICKSITKIRTDQELTSQNRVIQNPSKSDYSKGANLRVNLTLSKEDVYHGVTKRIKYKRKINCLSCIDKNNNENCDKCAGKKYIYEENIIDIEFPAGIEEGMILSSKGNGNVISGIPSENGDLLININEIDYSPFVRDGLNIISSLNLTLFEAITGVRKEIETMTGLVRIKIPPGVQSGKIYRLREKGFPAVKDELIRGDQLIVVSIYIPKFTNEQVETIHSILESGVDNSIPSDYDPPLWSFINHMID